MRRARGWSPRRARVVRPWTLTMRRSLSWGVWRRRKRATRVAGPQPHRRRLTARRQIRIQARANPGRAPRLRRMARAAQRLAGAGRCRATALGTRRLRSTSSGCTGRTAPGSRCAGLVGPPESLELVGLPAARMRHSLPCAWRAHVYHIISYHIISYHIISYHIISYHIISYHIISYHIISMPTCCVPCGQSRPPCRVCPGHAVVRPLHEP
jgi:hypothetical protein